MKNCLYAVLLCITSGNISLVSVAQQPVVLQRQPFQLNYSTSSIGYVQVILLDEAGNEWPGFGAADAPKICGDIVDAEVKWKNGKTIADLGDKPVRIKFVLRDADVYSFGIF